MANRADLLNQCFFGNRWVATHSPASGTTIVVQSPAATDGTSRPHLETLWYSIRNQTGAGSLQATVTVQVRIASIAGTVIASNEHLLAPSTSANVQLVGMGVPGKRGKSLFIGMNTVVASLTQSVSAAGWVEDTNG